MKIPSYTVALMLMLLPLVSSALAEGSGNPEVVHIVHGMSHPMSGLSRRNTFHIKLYVVGNPLEQVTIAIPDRLHIIEDAIAVTDEAGQPINTQIYTDDHQIVITFAQSVLSETRVGIILKNLRSPRYLRSWTLPVFARSTGILTEIPLGITQMRTR